MLPVKTRMLRWAVPTALDKASATVEGGVSEKLPSKEKSRKVADLMGNAKNSNCTIFSYSWTNRSFSHRCRL